MRSAGYFSGVLLVALLAACGPIAGTGQGGGGGATTGATAAPTSHGGPVRDHVLFVDALRAQGLAVAILGDVQQPFLQAPGTRLGVSGGAIAGQAEIQSYDYPTEGAARADAEQLDAQGNPPTMLITWVAPPHFFRRERLIALYVGEDPAVVRVLSGLLGPQFAGR